MQPEYKGGCKCVTREERTNWHLMNPDRHCLCHKQSQKKQVGDTHGDGGNTKIKEGEIFRKEELINNIMLQKDQVRYGHKSSDFAGRKCHKL